MRGIASLGLALALAISASGCTTLHARTRGVPPFLKLGDGYDTYIGYEHISLIPVEIGRNGWVKARYVSDFGEGTAWFNTRSLQILERNPHVFVD